MARGGASKLQVFTDFEHVMTCFKNSEGQRSESSAELIEGSNALLPQVIGNSLVTRSFVYGSLCG